jgi:3-phenylpropionate/cinnamic acid dioxygenase small subunit
MDLQAVSDKLEIAELLARYARAVDTKDWELWKSVFTPDARVDYTSAGAMAGPRDEVARWLEQGLALVPMTQHFISNVEVDLDGDRATVRAMFYNPMQLPGLAEQSYCGGYYHHDVVRTAEGWKSEKLVEENVWFVNPPFPVQSEVPRP